MNHVVNAKILRLPECPECDALPSGPCVTEKGAVREPHRIRLRVANGETIVMFTEDLRRAKRIKAAQAIHELAAAVRKIAIVVLVLIASRSAAADPIAYKLEPGGQITKRTCGDSSAVGFVSSFVEPATVISIDVAAETASLARRNGMPWMTGETMVRGFDPWFAFWRTEAPYSGKWAFVARIDFVNTKWSIATVTLSAIEYRNAGTCVSQWRGRAVRMESAPATPDLYATPRPIAVRQ